MASFDSRKDFDGLASYIKNNSHYDMGKMRDDRKCPDERMWIKVTSIISTRHPDPDVAFDGMAEFEVVNPPREFSRKE